MKTSQSRWWHLEGCKEIINDFCHEGSINQYRWRDKYSNTMAILKKDSWTFSDEDMVMHKHKKQVLRSIASAAYSTSARRTSPTINISITHDCSSCDFDEGEDKKDFCNKLSRWWILSQVSGLLLMISLQAKNVNSERERIGAATGRFLSSGRSSLAQDRAGLHKDLWQLLHQ